jgi:hypothetical protein
MGLVSWPIGKRKAPADWILAIVAHQAMPSHCRAHPRSSVEPANHQTAICGKAYCDWPSPNGAFNPKNVSHDEDEWPGKLDPFPLLPVAAWIADLNLVYAAANWSTRQWDRFPVVGKG